MKQRVQYDLFMHFWGDRRLQMKSEKKSCICKKAFKIFSYANVKNNTQTNANKNWK